MAEFLAQLLELAALSILCGTWTKLTIDAARRWPLEWRQALAIVALVSMSTSAAMMLLDTYNGVYSPHVDDRWLHAALGLWNALILLGVIRGTSYSMRRPIEPEVLQRQ